MQNHSTRQVRIRVTGHVQGVGFRYSTRTVGDALGLDVSARNLDDGSVLIDASGSSDAITELIDWARSGPPAARVATIDVQDVNRGDTT